MTIAGQWYRVSSDEEQSIEGQRPGMRSYISGRGYTIGPEYVTGDGTASAFKREQMAKLDEAIADMQAGRINVLVIRNTDRLDRTEELTDILKRVKAAGGRVESMTESWLEDISGLPAKVLPGVTEWLNAEYSRKISYNVIQSHDVIKANGFWVGSVPFGYRSEGEKRRKMLVPDAAEAAVTLEVFERMSTGRSATSIAAWLDTAAPQTITKTGKPSPWRARRVIKMVSNPVYKGQHETHTGYEAIVTVELWNSANAARHARSYESGGRRIEHAYSGVVYCSCGEPFYHHQSTRNGRPVGEAKYRCARGRRGIGAETRCGVEGIPFNAANWTIDALMASDSTPEYVTVSTGGDAERTARIQALEASMAKAAKAKDRKAQIGLLEEIELLEAAPAVPVITTLKRTGRVLSDVWASGSLSDRRALLKDSRRVVISVTDDGIVCALLAELTAISGGSGIVDPAEMLSEFRKVA